MFAHNAYTNAIVHGLIKIQPMNTLYDDLIEVDKHILYNSSSSYALTFIMEMTKQLHTHSTPESIYRYLDDITSIVMHDDLQLLRLMIKSM